jgi:hypothetical protein
MAETKPQRKKTPSPSQDKLNALGDEAIAERIASGETYREIAGSVGVGIGVLCAWMEADPERSRLCARARETSGQTFEEMAQEAIQDAADPFELAKAKELAVHWRWRAKAVNPRRYGDKVAVGGADDLPAIKGMPDDALQAKIAALTAKVNGKQS